MNRVECPHCGERNFRLLAARRIDRCASCGRAIATPKRARVEDKVREAFGKRPRIAGGSFGVRRPQGR